MAGVGAALRTSSPDDRKQRIPPKELEHIRVTPAENGGVSVEHHFTHYEHKPESHVFGESEGKEFVQHMLKHTGMKAEGLDLEHESEPEHGKEKVAPKK